jgi:hypothetical protein
VAIGSIGYHFDVSAEHLSDPSVSWAGMGWRKQMEKRTPIGNSDSLQRMRDRRAPRESVHLGETGAHVPKHFPGTEREPELEPPFELPPKKSSGLSRRKMDSTKSGRKRG